MSYEIKTEGQGFRIDLSGQVSFDEIADANDALFNHPDWKAHAYQIWCFSNASALLEDRRASRVISKVDGMSLERSHSDAIKIAFVCTNAKTIEFIEAYIDSVDSTLIEGRIFRSEAAARDWVNS